MTDSNEQFNLDMNKIMANTVSHADYMYEKLQDKDYQRIYLETSLEEFTNDGNINAFIRSLQHVVKARGRGAISVLARELDMDRNIISGFQPFLKLNLQFVTFDL